MTITACPKCHPPGLPIPMTPYGQLCVLEIDEERNVYGSVCRTPLNELEKLLLLRKDDGWGWMRPTREAG